MKKNNNQLYFAVIFVVLIIVFGVGTSYAYLNRSSTSSNSVVNVTLPNTSDLNMTYSGDTSMGITVTTSNLLSNKVGTAVSDTANVKISLTSNSNYTKGAKCTYTITYVATETFVPSTSKYTELTISGTDGTRSFAETSLANVSSKDLYSGEISTTSTTTVTHNWTFTMKFNNVNDDQSALVGKNPRGTIKIVAQNCGANS